MAGLSRFAQSSGTGSEDPGPIPTSTARSRRGDIAVETTHQGLPLAVHIDDSALRQNSSVLATQILNLCRRSAATAEIDMRAHLLASGVARDVVDSMGLATPDVLVALDLDEDAPDDDATSSWLRRV